MYGTGTPPSPPAGAGRRPGAVWVRVAFAAIPVLTLGLAMWAPSLRFAVLRKRTVDWAVFVLSVVLTAVYVALLITVPEDDGKGSGNAQALAGLYIVVMLTGAVVHAVLADRFPRPVREPNGQTGAAGPHPPGPIAAGPAAGGGPLAAGAYGPYGTSVQDTPPPSGTPLPLDAQVTRTAQPPGAPHTPPPPRAPHTPPPHAQAPQPPAPPAGPYAQGGSAPSPYGYPATGYEPQAAPPPVSPRMRQVASELDELGALLRHSEPRPPYDDTGGAPHGPRDPRDPRTPGDPAGPGGAA